MDFKSIQVMSMAVRTILEEIQWAPYGLQKINTPLIHTEEDCHKLDLLLDMLGTLTRMLDTRINYMTLEGKLVKEWVLTILELGDRYQKELVLLDKLMKDKTR
jgi:hypothetical protein